MRQEQYIKIGAILVVIITLYLLGIPSLSDEIEDTMIQLTSLVLVFASSLLIALESAKASYLEVLKSKHNYEANRVKDSIRDSFRIVFTQEAEELKSRKELILSNIKKLKEMRVKL